MVKENAKQRAKRKGEAELHELLATAAANTPDHPAVSRGAVRDIFRLTQRLRLRIPREEKRKLCKHCYAYLKPGVTSMTRIAKGRIIITCLSCKHVKRLQYRRGKK